MYLSPLVLGGFKIYSIEPEDLEIEKQLCSQIDKEPFLEFSCITYKNVPQPEGPVYRRSFETNDNEKTSSIEGPTLVKRNKHR